MPRAASSHVVDVERFGTLQRASAPCRVGARHSVSELLVAGNPNPGPQGAFFMQSSSPPGGEGGATPPSGKGGGGQERRAAPGGAAASRSGDRDLFVQVDVLNAVDEGGALGQR